MGFGSKLARRFKKIGHKIGRGVSIGARQAGKVAQKAGAFASRIAPLVSLIPDPRAQALADVLRVGGDLAQKTGKLTSEVGRSGAKALQDGDQKAFLERSRKQAKDGRKIKMMS